ncbi:MAG: hypothetical protein RIS76_3664 [Verrucomicrobiota bacterium]
MRVPERATLAREPGLPRTLVAAPPPTATMAIMAIMANTAGTPQTAAERGTAGAMAAAAAAETVVVVVVVAVIDPGRWWVDSERERFDIRLSPRLPHPAGRTAT